MRIIRLKEVIKMTGLSRSTIYRHIAAGLFPKQAPLIGRSVGFLESEIQGWISARIQERDLGGQ